MAKVHFKYKKVDAREMGQTQFDYDHQTLCGYVRDLLTEDKEAVTCKICQREMKKLRILGLIK